MKLAKLVCGCPCQSSCPGNQEHGKAIGHSLPFAIHQLACDRCPSGSFWKLDGEINNCALILIRKLSSAGGRGAHTGWHRGPKAIKNDSRNSHASYGHLPRSPCDDQLLKCGPE